MPPATRRRSRPREASPADGTLDIATDIYSLCLMMIESVTGQVPFASDSTVATLNARIDKLMPVSADFGPLASVLARAGSADSRRDRYTAAEFGRALVQAAENVCRARRRSRSWAAHCSADTTGRGLRTPASTPGAPLVDRRVVALQAGEARTAARARR